MHVPKNITLDFVVAVFTITISAPNVNCLHACRYLDLLHVFVTQITLPYCLFFVFIRCKDTHQLWIITPIYVFLFDMFLKFILLECNLAFPRSMLCILDNDCFFNDFFLFMAFIFDTCVVVPNECGCSF